MCGKTLKRRGKGWRQRLVTLAVENNWSQGLERGGLGGGGSVSSGRGTSRAVEIWRVDDSAVVDGHFSSQITELTSKHEQKSRCCFQ